MISFLILTIYELSSKFRLFNLIVQLLLFGKNIICYCEEKSYSDLANDQLNWVGVVLAFEAFPSPHIYFYPFGQNLTKFKSANSWEELGGMTRAGNVKRRVHGGTQLCGSGRGKR
jgi:hypothetical protein